MLYLLHATLPVGGTGKNSAQHYLGWTTPARLQARLERHRTGRGSRLTQAFMRLPGQQLLLVRIWPEGDRWMERRLHHNGHLRTFCPVCRPELPILLVPEPLRHQASLHSKLRSPKPARGSGGAWRPGNPIGPVTLSLLVPLLVSGIEWDSALALTAATLGGIATSALAMQSGPASTSPAGTRRRARSS